MRTLGRLDQKILALSAAAFLLLLLLAAHSVFNLAQLRHSAQLHIHDARHGVLYAQFDVSLTRAAGEAASYALTKRENYRREANEALDAGFAALAVFEKEIDSHAGHALIEDHHEFVDRYRVLLGLVARGLQEAQRPNALTDDELLDIIYAYEPQAGPLRQQVIAHRELEYASNEKAIERAVKQTIYAVAGTLLVFALFVAALFAASRRFVVKPIDRLANAAAAVASGDRNQAVAVQGPEEIERLQRSFNQMVVDLRSREQDLRAMIEQHEQTNRDLHDDVLQSIYAVGLMLERAQSTLVADAQAARARLGEAMRHLNGIMGTLRSYIVEPAALSGGAANVFAALTGLIRIAQENKTPKVDAALDPHALPNLSHEQAHHFLNIAREAISNAQRHARAHSMQVGLRQHDGCAQLTIRDDGCGFDTQDRQAQGHGLRNMAQRARLIQGDLAIESAPGAGTRIVLRLPLAALR